MKKKDPVDMSRAERLLNGWCPNCAQEGPHYAPPSAGSPGMFFCEEVPAPAFSAADAELS